MTFAISLVDLVLIIIIIGYIGLSIIDCANRKDIDQRKKILWILVQIFIPIIGVLLYLLLSCSIRNTSKNIAIYFGVGLLLLSIVLFYTFLIGLYNF